MVPSKRNYLRARSGSGSGSGSGSDRSALVGLTRLVEGEPDRAADAGPGEPGGDGTVLPRLQSVEHDTAVDKRTRRVDEGGIA
jgi:hypothetical protein